MKMTTTRTNCLTQEVYEFSISFHRGTYLHAGQEVKGFIEDSTSNMISCFSSIARIQRALNQRADDSLRAKEEGTRIAMREDAYLSHYGDWFQDDPIYREVVRIMAVDFAADIAEYGSTEKEVKKNLRPAMSDAKADLRQNYYEEYRDEYDKTDFYVSFAWDIAQSIA